MKIKFEKVWTEDYSKNPVVKKHKYGLFLYTKSGKIYTILVLAWQPLPDPPKEESEGWKNEISKLE